MNSEEIFNLCYELADKSSCGKMHFGSVIYRPWQDEIIGKGFNRPLHNEVKEISDIVCCELRKGIKSGTQLEKCTAIHAEKAAIFDAWKRGHWIEEVDLLYVAGKFWDGTPWVQNEPGFYCSFCSRDMYLAGIKNIRVMTKSGEKNITIEEALKQSYEFAFEKKVVKKDE
ncbi:hypothetical protein HYX19_00850 [Candidatus Woesearchaeota archaeon]|nr:hypothetical protein [Candidatus Woesearchaeota archaeon]